MAEETDDNLERQRLLDEISGILAAPETMLGEVSSGDPVLPSGLDLLGVPATPAPAVPAPRREPPVWVQHRVELASILMGFVGVVWLAVGVATEAWGPGTMGVGFLLAAIVTWAIQLWMED